MRLNILKKKIINQKVLDQIEKDLTKISISKVECISDFSNIFDRCKNYNKALLVGGNDFLDIVFKSSEA